jgi:glycosyltransferase involved in cell wall biosynthesis
MTTAVVNISVYNNITNGTTLGISRSLGVGLVDIWTQLPKYKLLIIGDGPKREEFEKLSKTLGLQERIKFTGWIEDNDQVYVQMQLGKVFVVNSRSEGGPRTAFEALALGLPLITTKVGSIQDFVIDGINGIFTDGSPSDLAKKIRYLLEDDALRERLSISAQKNLSAFNRNDAIEGYSKYLQTFAR